MQEFKQSSLLVIVHLAILLALVKLFHTSEHVKPAKQQGLGIATKMPFLEEMLQNTCHTPI